MTKCFYSPHFLTARFKDGFFRFFKKKKKLLSDLKCFISVLRGHLLIAPKRHGKTILTYTIFLGLVFYLL